MDIEITKLIVQWGISGISLVSILVLSRELDKRREILRKHIEINEKQNISMNEIKNEIIKMNERISK